MICNRWNPQLNWQPIPVWPISAKNNMYGSVFCKRFKKMSSAVRSTDPEVKRYLEENKDVYEYLSYYAGSNITQDEVFTFRQILFAEVNS